MPMTRSPAAIGTTMAERVPLARSAAVRSASPPAHARAAASSKSPISTGTPVRSTCAGEPGSSVSIDIASRMRSSPSRSPAPEPIAARRTTPRSSGTSTQHQSASSGTAAPATLSSVTSMSSEEETSMLAAERKRCWRSASRASVTSSMMLTASTTVAVLVAHRRRLGHRPALLAGGLDDRVRERRPWLRTGQRVAPGEVAQVVGPPVLVEDDEGVEQLGQRHREHLVGRRAAHHLGRRLVDVDERAVGRLHRHGGGEVGQHRLELALGAAELGEQPRVVEGQRGAARDLARPARRRCRRSAARRRSA